MSAAGVERGGGCLGLGRAALRVSVPGPLDADGTAGFRADVVGEGVHGVRVAAESDFAPVGRHCGFVLRPTGFADRNPTG